MKSCCGNALLDGGNTSRRVMLLALMILAAGRSEGWAPRVKIARHPQFQQGASMPCPSFRSNTPLSMALVPLPVDELQDLLDVGPPSGPQYAVYWGRTKREKYNRFLESSIVTFLGVFFSYFMSFVVGSFVATILGGVFAFWGFLSPDFMARQRNFELLGGRALVDPWSVDVYEKENKQGLYGSLFLGRVDDVCVVEDTSAVEEYDLSEFDDYTMDTDELEQLAGTPYLIRVRISDNEDRTLQVHARMNEDYLDIEAGMPVVAVLLSTSQSFSSLAALTDFWIPDADCWVGDYPYLNRVEVEALLEGDDELWGTLRKQGRGRYTEDELLGPVGESLYDKEDEKIKVRRKGRY